MAWLRRLVTGTDPGNVSEKAAEIQIRKKKIFLSKDNHRFVVSEVKFRLEIQIAETMSQ